MRILRARAGLASVLAAGLAGCSIAPAPLSPIEVGSLASDRVQRVVADQEPVDRPIDLYEAMARALMYNLDHRVELMETALRVRELDLAHYGLLPNLVASSGYAARNNDNASNSVNILTGVESLSTSTSQERRISTADVAFSWNILDFGLSYVRAKQSGDKFLIAGELRRKVAHRVVEDVRTAYWRAVSADRLLERLRALEERVRSVQANTRAIQAERHTSLITAVTYERELVEIKRTIQELERDLVVARTQLASLMNLKPGTKYTLVHLAPTKGTLSLKMPVDEMIYTAMHNRAELREVWYRQRINSYELEAAFLELLPGVQVYAGTNYDSNDFIYNNNWVNWGAKASWNLLRLAQYPAKREVINAQDRLLDARSLALTMAIMTQVHVSRVRFHHYGKELATASEYLDVQRRLVELMRSESRADRISEQTLIREEMNTLVAEVKRDIAFANLQNAFANVYASMGLDPYHLDTPATGGVKQLARELHGVWLERGDQGAAEKPAEKPKVASASK